MNLKETCISLLAQTAWFLLRRKIFVGSIYAALPLMHICKACACERGGFYGRAQLQPFLCCWEDYCLQCVGSAATLRPIDWSPGLMLCWGTGCHIDLRQADMRWQWDLLGWRKYMGHTNTGSGWSLVHDVMEQTTWVPMYDGRWSNNPVWLDVQRHQNRLLV